jgi:hypothetical protein
MKKAKHKKRKEVQSHIKKKKQEEAVRMNRHFTAFFFI